MKKLNDFEDYVAAEQKLADLKTQRHTVETNIQAVLEQINATAKPDDPVHAKAQALVDGVDAPAAGNGISGKREQYQELYQKLKIHEAAVKIQEHAVATLRLKCSIVICKEAEKEYLTILKKAISSAVSYAKDYTAARDFINELRDDGVAVTMPDLPIHLHHLGSWDNSGSNIHALLNDATKAGLVNGEYGDRPEFNPTPGIPDDGVERLAAGPDGVRTVTMLPGQKVKTRKWLHKTQDDEGKPPFSGSSGKFVGKDIADS